MKPIHKILTGLCFTALLPLASCTKFLDAKSKSSLALITSLEDYQAVMNNETHYNNYFPYAGDVASDFYYMKDAQLSIVEDRNIYLWQAEPPYARYNWDWPYQYKVYPANNVLEGIDNVPAGNLTETDRKHIKGAAYFSRGFIFYHLAQMYSAPYNPAEAARLPGIPVRTVADINVPVVRNTMEETYTQILHDLKEAARLLPDVTSIATKPSKAAAYAALSRVYQVMHNHPQALVYADSCLRLYSTLMDYNKLDTLAQFPIKVLNPEVIFHARRQSWSGMARNTVGWVDSVLYQSYSDADLRKKMFYKKNSNGVLGFYADYGASTTEPTFYGIATDEVLLTRAEERVRAGDVSGGIEDLNTLLRNRYRAGSFTSLHITDPEEALKIILQERQKELAFRSGIRWADLRRLNYEKRTQKTIHRMYEGKLYSLAPGDARYTFLIPYDVINISGLEQNP